MKKGSANYDYTDGPTNFGRINPESWTGFTVITYTIKGRFYTLISNFLVFFYKHVLQKRTGKTKIYFERKSEEELNSKKRGLHIHSLPQKKPTL